MENKNNNVLVIILLIVVVCLTGFIVYDKVSSNKNNFNPTENNGNNTNQNNQDNNVKETSNSFELFKNNLIKERKEKYDTSKDKYIVNTDSAQTTYSAIKYNVRLNNNGDLEVSYIKNDQTLTKTIASNVLLYEITYAGNGGSKELFFIKEDGTVSQYQIESLVDGYNGNIEVKNNLGNFKNIVAIISGTVKENDTTVSFNPSFVDINGNILSLNY